MKEQKIISYAKGITHSPSDMICGDGELEECVNLEVKSEELVPMEMPVKLPFSLGTEEKLLLVHNTKSADKHYVVYRNTSSFQGIKIFKVSENQPSYFGLGVACGEVKSIQSLGNTIVAYTSDSVHYILYSGGNYKYIGSKIPEVNLSFTLKGQFEVSDIFTIKTPNHEMGKTDEYGAGVCSQLIPEVNKFIEEHSTSKGLFMYPFFVRYALRLYDGTHTHQSAPVLLLPSTNVAPFAMSYSFDQFPSGKDVKVQIGSFIAKLKASVEYVSDKLENWSDIIKGVDIFVSRQISTYDQNGTKFGSALLNNSKFIGEYNDKSTSIWNARAEIGNHIKLEQGENESLFNWNLPVREAEEVTTEIVNTSLFYKYATLGVNELNVNSVKELSGSFDEMGLGETLKDDYMTHDTLIPENSFVYNGRLNISNVERKLFEGFRLECMASLVKSDPTDGYSYDDLAMDTYEVYTYIKSSEGNDIIVKSPFSGYGGLYGSFLFYPDTDAYKMVIVNQSKTSYAELSLTEHPMLNGAYAFLGFKGITYASGSKVIKPTDNTDKQMNKLYVSNVNNPFHFPLEGIYTIGSDRIIGVGAVTRPISQGQFGEFPLIAFCSDGNYAMRVDEQGYYTSISPVQEDLVLGSDKITTMEDSLAVITKRGVMLTTGGEMTKLAIQMDGGVMDTSTLTDFKTKVTELETLVTGAQDTTGFLSYVYGSRMAFDYASNRLLIYHPDKTYSYFYHFEGGSVSKMVLNGGKKIVTSVIDYPDTILQDEEGGLYSLYDKNDVSTITDRQYGVALTRPLKFGAAMGMKAIRQVMHLSSNCGNGSFVKYILYGSNDNVNYGKVSSRFGKPYKYYRVAVYTSLLPKESLSGSALTIEERRTHKLR